MNVKNKIMNFIHKLLSKKSDVSSHRFLGIFIFTPAILFGVFFGIPLEYVIILRDLLLALMVYNAVNGFSGLSKLTGLFAKKEKQ